MLSEDLPLLNSQRDKANRLQKGFAFESEICHVIEQRISYDYFQHNPLEYDEWLHNVGEGCDLTLIVEGVVFNIECKYLETNKIYPSYIWRDYIPRFKGKSGYCVIVTNNKCNIPYDCRVMLYEHNIKVWNSYELTHNIATLTNAYLNSSKKKDSNIKFNTETENKISETPILSSKPEKETPTNSKMPQETIDHERSKTKPEEQTQAKSQIFDALFQTHVNSILSIPFNRNVMKDFEEFLLACFLPYSPQFIVNTKNSKLDVRKYIRIFTKNLFTSFSNQIKLMKKENLYPSDIPIMYHGTTTSFLREILRDGLLPSKAGKCWIKDIEKKVYFTDSLYNAEYYARYAFKKFGGKPVILAIDMRKIENKPQLSPEEFQEGSNKIVTIFDIYKQLVLKEPVPSTAIKNWYILPKEISLFCTIRKTRKQYLNQLMEND